MATSEDALTQEEQAKLKAFAQGLPDNPGEIDVNAIAQQTGTSRRQVLQVIAAVGVGSIAGGVSVSQLVAEAQAQASTSDGDGNVGTPSDRVDVFADGIDSSVIDTGDATLGALRSERAAETISSDEIPASAMFITVNTSDGSAGTLEGVSGGSDTDIIILKTAGPDITVRDGTGATDPIHRIRLPNDQNFTLTPSDRLVLQYDTDVGGGRWITLSAVTV